MLSSKQNNQIAFFYLHATNTYCNRLVDMIQGDETIYLVFDYFDIDLGRYMHKLKRKGLTHGHIKVN